MLDEDLVKVLEVDEEVLELMAASVVGVHMAIERAVPIQNTKRTKTYPYQPFCFRTFIFSSFCLFG